MSEIENPREWQFLSHWWSQLRGRVFLAYGGSVLGVCVAGVLTHMMSPLHATPTVLFFAAVALAAWLGGKGPVVLATLLSILTVDFLFVHPRFSLLSSLADLVRFGAFTLVAFLICYLQESYQRIAAKLRQANDGLEVRVQGRTADLIAANETLSAEIEERRRTEAALKESESKLRVAVDTTTLALKENKTLLRELNHRVKNNLQIINSLLSLQGRSISDRTSQDCFKECQQRVRAIALVHDRLYRAPNLATLDLTSYINDLVQNLLRSYCGNSGAVISRIVVDKAAVGIDHIVPCVLILNELVCNALKYAFPEGRSGEVRVELRRRDGHVSLMVADDGVGFSGLARGDGVGQQIVQALVGQLSGNLEWANGRGTCATVTFPETQQPENNLALR